MLHIALRVHSCVVQRVQLQLAQPVIAHTQVTRGIGVHHPAHQLALEELTATRYETQHVLDVAAERVCLAQSQPRYEGQGTSQVIMRHRHVDVHPHVTHRVHKATLQCPEQRHLRSLHQVLQWMDVQKEGLVAKEADGVRRGPHVGILRQGVLHEASQADGGGASGQDLGEHLLGAGGRPEDARHVVLHQQHVRAEHRLVLVLVLVLIELVVVAVIVSVPAATLLSCSGSLGRQQVLHFRHKVLLDHVFGALGHLPRARVDHHHVRLRGLEEVSDFLLLLLAHLAGQQVVSAHQSVSVHEGEEDGVSSLGWQEDGRHSAVGGAHGTRLQHIKSSDMRGPVGANGEHSLELLRAFLDDGLLGQTHELALELCVQLGQQVALQHLAQHQQSLRVPGVRLRGQEVQQQPHLV